MLKIKLERKNTELTMTVLEQSPEATAMLKRPSSGESAFTASNGLHIVSAYTPSLTQLNNILYVRGSDYDAGHNSTRVDFESSEKASAAYYRIVKAVDEFNAKYQAIHGKPKSVSTTDSLPPMTFKPGDKVWTPSEGFCTLHDNHVSGMNSFQLSDSHQSYTFEGKAAGYHAHRAILTLEEAAKLGLTPPKRKVKKTISIWGLVRTTDGGVGYGSASKSTSEAHLKTYPGSYKDCEIREFTTEIEVDEE